MAIQIYMVVHIIITDTIVVVKMDLMLIKHLPLLKCKENSVVLQECSLTGNNF